MTVQVQLRLVLGLAIVLAMPCLRGNAGDGSSSSRLKADLPITSAQLQEILCASTEIPKDEATLITSESKETDANENLTWVVLRIPFYLKDAKLPRKDFDSATQSVTAFALALQVRNDPKVFAVIQNDYIEKLICLFSEPDIGFGTIEYSAPDIYSGRAEFRCERRAEKWAVVAFTLPEKGITTELQETGLWKVTKGREALHFSTDGDPSLKE